MRLLGRPEAADGDSASAAATGVEEGTLCSHSDYDSPVHEISMSRRIGKGSNGIVKFDWRWYDSERLAEILSLIAGLSGEYGEYR